MNQIGSVAAYRLAFLERELDRMGQDAHDAEHELRVNPTDDGARRRVQAIYLVAAEIWTQIKELRARHTASGSRPYRQALG